MTATSPFPPVAVAYTEFHHPRHARRLCGTGIVGMRLSLSLGHGRLWVLHVYGGLRSCAAAIT
eukprot:scaffold147825_cov28-Tisochrysis_lutea.AAC.1